MYIGNLYYFMYVLIGLELPKPEQTVAEDFVEELLTGGTTRNDDKLRSGIGSTRMTLRTTY